jgi:hypothetical protein
LLWQIAQSSLSSICRAVGVNSPQDSIELRDKPLMVKLAVKPADGQYSASNEIKGYEAAKGRRGYAGGCYGQCWVQPPHLGKR